MKEIYKEAFSEIEAIFKLMPINLLNKIPNRFRQIVEDEKAKEYNPIIKEPIEDCKLKDETIILLALIYRDFLCDEKEKIELKNRDIEELKKVEEELREKYNPDNLFKNKKHELNEEEKSLVTYDDRKWFQKIWDFISNIFKSK